MSDRKRRWSAWRLGLFSAGMFAFGFLVAPLYGFICEVSGIQNVTSSTLEPIVTDRSEERYIDVHFDSSVQSDLPWEFIPEVRKKRVRVGVPVDVNYRVRNLTGNTTTGQAVHNVVPWQATRYFSKAECFCFRKQTLKGGESVNLPLRFVVSPELPKGTETLTVSYIFMRYDNTGQRRTDP